MSRFLGTLLKTALGAGVIYVVYKVGQSDGKNKEREALQAAKSDLEFEIEFIEDLLKDYDGIPNKTREQWDKKQMLEMKLEVLRQKL
jgi:hypothetical protein